MNVLTPTRSRMLAAASAGALAASVAVVLVGGRDTAGATTTTPNLPYVIAEYATNSDGVPQPMVIGPDGTVVVDSAGVIDSSKAGTLGATTQTDGLQEAVDYAVNSGLDLYITGGRATTAGGGGSSNNNVYFLDKTLMIPPAQDFRIDGGESVINYDPTLGDAVTIDSCEDCHFRFGLVVTGATNGSAVAFRPTNPTNLDHLKVITDSTFEFSSIATSKPTGTSAYALNLDATNGPILWNDFTATAAVGFQHNVRLHSPSTTNAAVNNGFRIVHNHQSIGSMIEIEANSNNNHWVVNDDRNASTGTGIDDWADGNVFTLQSSGFPAGEDVTFEAGATNNLVLAVGPVSVTDRNRRGANRVITGAR